MDLKEIKRLVKLKYKLNGKKAAKTFIFSQAKKYFLTDSQINVLIDTIEKEAEKENKKKQKDILQLDFTCNIF